jgi:hypothetical protein
MEVHCSKKCGEPFQDASEPERVCYETLLGHNRATLYDNLVTILHKGP